jgi:hypothetical protein
MTTYKGINGFAVQSLATDPTFDDGQVWYNNTSYAFKLSTITTAGTFASGPNLNTARNSGGNAHNGTQTAALLFCGTTPSTTTATEKYDGTSWTTSGAYPTSLYQLTGFGTQTAAVGAGGHPPEQSLVATFNGTSWTSGTSLPFTTRASGLSVGTNTAGLVGSGIQSFPPFTLSGNASYNGSSWTSISSLNNPTYNGASFGIQTAAVVYGGSPAPGSPGTTTELWNGSTWTNNPTGLPAAGGGFSGGAGTQSLGAAFTMDPSGTAAYLWNGSSWSVNPNSPATARSSDGQTGTQAAAIIFGGSNDPGPSALLASSEFFTGPGAQVTKTITTS